MDNIKQKSRKVLYVITKSNWGGAQKYVYDLATNLPRDIYESVVVFGGHGPLAEKLASAGVRTISMSRLGRDISLFGDILSFFKFLKIFKAERPDVVHVNSSKGGGLGALAARIVGVPRIIFTCHGWPFNEDRGYLSLLIIRLLSWVTVILSHTTITVSNRDFHDGKEMIWVKNKIFLVHNGIKVPDFKERAVARAEIETKAKEKNVTIAETDFLVGAIGELHKNKSYEYALEAVSALKQKNIPVKFVILGEGEEKKKLENKIHKLSLEKEVALLGFVKDAPEYLKAFDTFVLSSIKEGLPYVLIETGFAGLPTIATNVGGAGEIIDDMKSGILVQTRKPDDMAQALELLYSNREKASVFGQNLRQKVEQEFSLEKMVEKTMGVYKSVLK